MNDSKDNDKYLKSFHLLFLSYERNVFHFFLTDNSYFFLTYHWLWKGEKLFISCQQNQFLSIIISSCWDMKYVFFFFSSSFPQYHFNMFMYAATIDSRFFSNVMHTTNYSPIIFVLSYTNINRLLFYLMVLFPYICMIFSQHH